MGRVTFLIACVLVCLSAGGLAAQEAPAPDVLADLRAAWVQGLEQQDLEASVALFTQDAIFLTPDGARYDDRAAIRTLYRSVFATYRSRPTMTSKRQECAGKLCVDEGTYSETMTETKTNKQLALTGSYLLVAKRQPDGAWKIAEMVWTGGAR
jgi:uncharacterized protein (TIGR02246 family)